MYNKLDDTILISGLVGFTLLCLGVSYNVQPEQKEYTTYENMPLAGDEPIRFGIVKYGGSKTRRKK